MFLQKLKIVWSKYFTKRYPALILVLFIVVVILLAVYLTSQQHDLRKQARTQIPSFIPTQTPQPLASIQRPAGVFGVFPINELEKFDVDEFKTDIITILDNPAISGVALRERWENLEPREGNYDFSRIDEVINLANQYNKKVQLILVPGFFTPQWVLDKIPLCDFKNLSVICGKASFTISYGPDSGEVRELPLPWSEIYKKEWQSFLQQIAYRYNNNDTVVSVAVAGPTSMSAEMSLPNETDEEKEKWRRLLALFFPDLDLTDPNTNPNQTIIEEWKKAIDFYGATFHTKTFVLTLGAGLLDFQPKQQQGAKAREEILAYFVSNATSVGNNLKATQTSGLKACRGEAGIAKVKQATQNPALSPRILGGAQFNSSVSDKGTATMGCLDCAVENRQCDRNPSYHPCCSLTVTQAAQNVLYKYFNETLVGGKYCNTEGECGVKGDALLHYLQLYKEDLLAAENDNQLQSLLMTANQDLFSMSHSLPPSIPTLSPIPKLSPTPTPVGSEKPRGVYALIEFNGIPTQETLNDSNVDGLVIRTYWEDVNPSSDSYDWQYLDSRFEEARLSNKRVHLIIAPGFHSPKWVLERAPTAKFKIPYGPGKGELHDFPISWDENYLNLWFNFISKVANRYGNHPSLSYISATGPNSHNGEMSLPEKGEDQNGNPITWLDFVEGNNREEKIAKLRENLLEAWSRTFYTFNTAFNGKVPFTIALTHTPFPVAIQDEEFQQEYKEEIVREAVENFPSSFGLQSNGLDGRPVWTDNDPEPNWNWELIESYSGTILTGFQTNAPSKLYPENPGPNDPSQVEILRQTVNNCVLTFGGKFLEIYESDILDPALGDIVQEAHEKLNQ